MALTNWFHENCCISFKFSYAFKWIFVSSLTLIYLIQMIFCRTSHKSLKGSLLISVDHGFSTTLVLLTFGQIMNSFLWVALLCVIECLAISLTSVTRCHLHSHPLLLLAFSSLPVVSSEVFPYCQILKTTAVDKTFQKNI